MRVDVDTKNKSISITLDDNEWRVVTRASPTELRDVLANYFKSRSAGLLEEDLQAISAKLRSATEAQVQAVKMALGL
jgi:hypothetical protein